MFKRILLPTDGSEVAVKAIPMVIGLAKSFSAKVYAISVKDPYPYSALAEIQPIPPQVYLDKQEALAQRNLDLVKRACEEAGVGCDTHTAESVHPFEEIIAHAKRNDCDLIVMASHGRRGMQALLLGSETQKVLTHTNIPVLVVR